MLCRSHRNGPRILFSKPTTLLGLLLLLPPSVLALQPPSPNHHPNPYGDYSPPMATVLIVLVGLFFTAGFLSIYLRHYAWCLGINFGRRSNGDGGGAWGRRYTARGLDPAVVESFPTFIYSDVKMHRIGKGLLECAVCLNEFTDDEILRLLPGCSHVFHPRCIGPWLASHVTCPVCRTNLEFQEHGSFDSLARQLQRQQSQEEPEPLGQDTQTPREVIIPVRPSPDVMKSPVFVIKDGHDPMGKLARSHSTGHSLVEDCERFTLRLPEEVRNKLVTANFPVMISPRIGYRTRSVGGNGLGGKPDRWRFSVSPPFFIRPGAAWSPSSDGADEGGNVESTGIMSGARGLFKSNKSPLNRVVGCSDIGERSSDRLWPNRPAQELEVEDH